MQKIEMIKKLLIRFWPVLFIFLLWFVFAYPYFIKGLAPYSSSYQLNNFAPWSAYPQFAGPVKNGAMPDVTTQILPWRHLAIQIWKQGVIPLWNPYSFAGTPLLANYQSAALSPFNILFFLFPFVDGWSILILLQPLLAGMFTYLFVRSLGKTKLASTISSVSFMFCGFLTVWMDYGTLGYAILFLPLSLYFVEQYFNTQKIKSLIFLSLSIPLSFFSGHFQISIYFFLTLLLYVVFKSFINKNLKAFLKLCLFIFFGVLISMPQLLPSIEFYTQSFRSDIFQKEEVIPFSYLPTLLSPDLFGNPVTRNDWFGHYAEWNGFIGIFPLFLSFYFWWAKKKIQGLFFFITGIVALLFSLNSPFADFLVFLKIPVLSGSAGSRGIVVYSFMFSVLSAFGFDQLFLDIKDKKFSRVLIFLISTLFIFILLWVLVYSRTFIPWDKTSIARSNLILPTSIFVAGFVIVALSTLNKKLLYICSFLILLLVSFDMLRFAIKWQAFEQKSLIFADTPASKEFAKIAGQDRSMSNLEAGVGDYYNLLSLEGYDALYIKRYGEFAASISNGTISESARSVVLFPKDSPNTSAIINLLDVKYVIHKFSDGRNNWTFPFWTYPVSQFEQISKDSGYEFYQNNDSFGHVFLSGNYKVIKDPQEIIKTLTSKDINLKKEIILEKDPNIKQTNSEIGSANIIKYSPSEVEIEVNASSSGLLFLSDNYYNGWNATVDGVSTPIYRADFSFRAVPVKEGKYLVRFTYQPWSFYFAVFLAIVGGLGIVITFFFSSKILVPKSSS